MVYVVSQVKADDIFALHKTDPALSGIFLATEYVTQFVQPLCGKLQHERINTSIQHHRFVARRRCSELLPYYLAIHNLWFEPATTRKIAVLSHRECATVLRHDLGPENVPKRFGGDLDWEFGGSPELSPDAKPLSKKWVDKWVEGPLRIIDGPGEQWRIIAVGSQNGELRREEL
ncbi:hypothetical protein LTR93_011976 [Exophiala xenobiotica]|nr:hypothetical protein LTR93_011976 [Exophiala xenobiotica]